MPTTIDIRDAVKLASAITSAGGTIPEKLGYLLAGFEVLSRPARQDDPAMAIMDHVLAGTLDEKTLAKLLPAAAAQALANQYRGDLARQAEHVILGQIHRELKAGGCDEILASIRPKFDEHAEKIAEARSLIDPNSTAEHVIESGQPELVTAWKDLPVHLQAIEKLSAIARSFGPRLGQFSQITEFAQAENFRLADAAITCTTGGLLADSALFMRPDQGHRSSPWFRCGGLKLHSIAEAQARYNEFAASEFDRIHSGPRGGWIGADNQVHTDPAPKNPYREEVDA